VGEASALGSTFSVAGAGMFFLWLFQRYRAKRREEEDLRSLWTDSDSGSAITNGGLTGGSGGGSINSISVRDRIPLQALSDSSSHSEVNNVIPEVVIVSIPFRQTRRFRSMTKRSAESAQTGSAAIRRETSVGAPFHFGLPVFMKWGGGSWCGDGDASNSSSLKQREGDAQERGVECSEKEEDLDRVCSICLVDIEDDELVKDLACSHAFHAPWSASPFTSLPLFLLRFPYSNSNFLMVRWHKCIICHKSFIIMWMRIIICSTNVNLPHVIAPFGS